MTDHFAFGYVRVASSEDDALDTLHDLITEFADGEGYTVAGVYADYGTAPDSLVRCPGFRALVAGLGNQTGVVHVLVPDLEHLSPFPAVRAALTAELGSSGSTVVQVRPEFAGGS